MEMGEMKKKIFEVDTELAFGKHKGFTIGDVFSMDYQYLVWMYENFENAEWSNGVLKLVTEAYDLKEEEKSYFGGLSEEDAWLADVDEYNLFK